MPDTSTAPAAADPDAQAIYNELNTRNVFMSDQEAQAIGHELRARGVVSDPTQGGLVKPASRPRAAAPDSVDPYGDAGLQTPPAPAPMPAAAPHLNALQQILGLGDTHGTFYNSGKAALQGLAAAPEEALKTAGNMLASQYGIGADSYEQHQAAQDPASRAVVRAMNSNPVTGDQSMIGQGEAAAKAGTFGKFAAGVPAGIAKETVQNPVGQILNVVSLVGGGEMTLSAGARGLMANATRLEAAAGAASTAEEAAQLSQMAARSRAAAQAMNRTAFQIHRAATGGRVGDAVREAAATAAETIAPGSDVARTLRGKVEFQQAGLRNLRAQAAARQGAKDAARATAAEQEARAAAATIVTPGASAAPLQLAAPDAAIPPEPNAGQPRPGQGPNPLAPEPIAPAPAPEAQPTPTTQPMPSPSPEPALAPAPVVPKTAPTSAVDTFVAAKTSPGGFLSDYQNGLKVAAQNVARTEPGLSGAEVMGKAAAAVAYKLDPQTGLLNHDTLLKTIQSAMDHGQITQEPALYVHAQASAATPEATTQLANFLADQTKSAGGHVSWYSPDAKSVGAVYVGPNSAAFTAALAAASAAADKHQQDTNQAAPGQPAMRYGVTALQPGMKPEQVIKTAQAAAQGGAGNGQSAAGQSAGGGPVSGAGSTDVSQQSGNISAALLGGQSGGTAQAAGTDSRRSEAGTSAARGNQVAAAAEHSAAGSSAAPVSTGPALNAEPRRSEPASAGNVKQATLGPYSTFAHNGEHYDNLSYNPHDPADEVRATSYPMQAGGVPIGKVNHWPNVQAFEQATGHTLYLEPQGRGETVAQLSPAEKSAVLDNLGKVKDDPEVAALAAQATAEVKAHGATKPKEEKPNADTKQQPGQAAADPLRADGAAAVEGGAPADVRPAGKEGKTANVADRGATDVQAGNREPDGRGVSPERSGGSGVPAVSVPAERTGDANPGTGPVRAEQSPGGSVQVAGGEPAAGSKLPEDKPVKNYVGHVYINYQATPEDAIGKSTLGQKRRDLVFAIRTYKKIVAENRMATPEEQKILIKFPGWGWTGNSLNRSKEDTDGELLNTLLKLVTPKELSAAKFSAVNSHYTEPYIIEAMWKWIADSGFTGGKVLEPSAGIGLFLALMPSDLRATSKVRAVEKDSLTGGVLRQLQQDTRVDIGGYEEQAIANDFYDLVVSNVPFGRIPIKDKQFDRMGMPASFSAMVHNYYFVKSLRVTRPGGLIAFITSHGTLDSAGSGADVRKYLDENAYLVGGMRLPNNTFKGNAATDVTTDVLFFQKKGNGAVPTGETFLEIKNLGTNAKPILVNEYFARHPEFVMGTHSLEGKMRGRPMEYTLQPFPSESLPETIPAAMQKVPHATLLSYVHEVKEQVTRNTVAGLKADTRRGQYLAGAIARTDDGKIAIIQPGGDQELVTHPDDHAQLGHYLDLRDALLATLQGQLDGVDDAALANMQKSLKKAYDTYHKNYGLLSKSRGKGNNSLWIDDPDAQNVLSLEIYRTEREPTVAGKKPRRVQVFDKLSDQFTQRTLKPAIPPTSAAGAREGLIVSLRESPVVNLKRIEELTGLTRDSILSELEGTVFHNPIGGYELGQHYGAGNVRQKLNEAVEAAQQDKKYKANVSFLETVQPKTLTPADIKVKIGAPWLPPDVLTTFAEHISEQQGVKFTLASTDFSFTWHQNSEYAYNTTARSTFGTEDLNSLQLLSLLLNAKIPRVYDGRGEDRVLNPDKTALAQAKQDKIKDTWNKWVMSDPERAARLAGIYNREVNVMAREKYDGVSIYARRDAQGNVMYHAGKDGKPDTSRPMFEITGQNPMINLRTHQVNAAYRALVQQNTLWAHEVGTGKTFTGIMFAMEARRTGVRNKPMILVKPRTLPQIAADFMKLYPGAKILVGDADSVDGAEKRQRFMARIATGNWDAVIVSHDTLNLLPVHPELIEQHYAEIIAEQREAMENAIEEDGKSSFTVKAIEQVIASLEKKLDAEMKKVTDSGKDTNIYFEELGIDHFIVDEAQKYKNQTVTSARGMAKTGAPFATSFFIKMKHVQSTGGGVTFMTGTPLTNSIAEIHTLMKMLAPKQLAEAGLTYFDAFSAQYAENITRLERTTDLQYKEKTKLGLFSNIPELMDLYTSFTDPVLAQDVAGLVRPRMRDEEGSFTDKPVVVTSKPNPHQMAYFRDAKRRTRAIVYPVSKGMDTVISIGTDVRLASLDVRLKWNNAPDYPDSKINQVVGNVYKNYADPQNMKNKRTQLIFLDLGIDLLYKDIKDKLVDLGIPAGEIAFISDANENQLEDLFDDVNDGLVRVMIGSREKMGVGVNVQKRLIAIHQVDPTYRPDQMEQADGRILRQGNMFADAGILIYQYVNVGTGDSFMWNKSSAKAKYIRQVVTGTAEQREAEDIEGEDELSQDEIDSIADGNPSMIPWQQIKKDIANLESVEASDAQAKRQLKASAEHELKTGIPNDRAQIAKMEKQLEYIKENKPAKFEMSVGETHYGEDDKVKAAEALWAAAKGVPEFGKERPIGKYRGYTVKAEHDLTQEKPQIKFTLTPGNSGESLITKRYSSHYDTIAKTGLITTLDNTLDQYPDRIAAKKSQTDKREQEIPKQLAAADLPFEDAAALEKMKEKEQFLRKAVVASEQDSEPEDHSLVFTKADYVVTKADVKRMKDTETVAQPADAKKGYYRLTTSGWVTVNGKAVKMPPGYEGLDLFTTKGATSATAEGLGVDGYMVIEGKSGLMVGNAKTLAAAISQAKAKIEDMGLNAFESLIEKNIERNTRGQSPRYTGERLAAEAPEYVDDDAEPPSTQDARAFNSAAAATSSAGTKASAEPAPARPAPTPAASGFVAEDVTPALKAGAQVLTKMQDALFRVLSPASIDNAGIAARSFREYGAAKAQQEEIAFNELKAFRKLLRGMDRAKRLDFYNIIETGGRMPTPELQAFADMLRKLLDDARDEVRALGTGKLDQFLTDYMPHYYKDLGKAKEYYAKHYGQRGLNPSASFLKQRTYDTLADAMAAGLEPKSDDPIEMVMTKVKEMHRYVMAQRVLADIKTNPDLSQYVGAVDGHPKGTWEPLEGTQVWKGSSIEVKEAYDQLVMQALEKVMADLKISHARKATLPGGRAWGQTTAAGKVETRFGGPESALLHEIGHVVDIRYKAWDFLTAPGLRVLGVSGARVKIGQELKDLAALRYEGQPLPGPAYRQYVNQRGEKVANAIAAMIYAPEKMQQAAPTVLLRLKRLMKQHPELLPLLDIKPSLVMGERSQDMDVGGRILAGQYYAPPEVARIYNNYLSPGLNGNNIFYDALRFVGNAMNQAQLGLSGFHFMFTLNDAMFSQLAVGVQRLGVGTENVIRGTASSNKQQVTVGMKQISHAPLDMLKALIAVYSYPSLGAKFQKEYYHPGTQGVAMARIVDAAIAGGVRVKMDSHYQNDALSKMWKSLRAAQERTKRGNVVGGVLHGAAGLAQAPFALVEATAKPLMEKWVPLLKAGAVTNLLQQAIDDLPPGADLSRDDLRKMAAQAVDTVDDRMGQLNYDNLFWNKVFKDVLMGSTRSVGWNVGSLRIIVGAGYDVLSTPKRLMSSRGAGGGGQQPPGGGKLPPGGAGGGAGGSGGTGGFGYEPVVTQRIAYMIALLMGAGLLGAFYQYLHTGKRPESEKDLYFPRTGKMGANGKPERVQMATYVKDVHGYTTQPVQTLANKLHPVLSTAYDAMDNKDYFGTEIRNPDDPIVKQMQETAKYALTQFEPFSFTNAQKSGVNLLSERGAENFFGITPAPKDIDFTAAEKMMLAYLRESTGDTHTQAQMQQMKERGDLVKSGRAGENIRAKLEAAVQSGDMTMRQARATYKAQRETWQVQKFQKLPAEQALKVFEAGTPEEKRTFAPLLHHKEQGQSRQFRTKAIDALRAMTK